MPLRPATMELHAVVTSFPTGDTTPIPVTTTRRLLNSDSYRYGLRLQRTYAAARGCRGGPDGSGLSLGLVRVDVIDGLLHRRDLFGIFIGNFRFELLLKCHDQLYRIQRVGAEIVDERSAVDDFFFLHAQLFSDYLLNLLLNRTHRCGFLSDFWYVRRSNTAVSPSLACRQAAYFM